ncbi:MAG: spore germination protein, partial [Clostridia bacterium]|nr:spore germination protein [Clostridia bacterium]
MSKKIKRDFGESSDLILRPAVIAGKEGCYFAIEGLIDKEMLEERVIKPLSSPSVDLTKIEREVYLSSPVKRARTAEEAERAIAEGMTAL